MKIYLSRNGAFYETSLFDAIDLASKKHLELPVFFEDYGRQLIATSIKDVASDAPIFDVSDNTIKEWRELKRDLLAIYNKGFLHEEK